MSKYSTAPISEMKPTKARKEHRCTTCGSQINIGEEYWREHTFLRGLSRPLAEVCRDCHSQGKIVIPVVKRVSISKRRGGTKEGALDRFLEKP